MTLLSTKVSFSQSILNNRRAQEECQVPTKSCSGRLEEGRVVVLSRFILPPPDVELLATGVLDSM